jgi:hypothetical protein
MPSPYKLIATDIDGTLLTSHHELTPRTERALKRAQAEGLRVILATGRARTNRAVELLETLQLTTPAIFLQGGAIYEADGRLRHNHPLDHQTARQLIEFGEARGWSMVAYCGTEFYTQERNEFVDLLVRYKEATPHEVGSLMTIWEETVFNKLVIFAPQSQIAGIRAQYDQQFGPDAAFKMVVTLPTSLELIPAHISKGAALQELMDEFGVERHEVIAFGDAENDIEMLQVAGLGVAMNNAMPVTLAVADRVAPSNDDEGVAAVLEEVLGWS